MTEQRIRETFPQLRALLAKVQFLNNYNLTTLLDSVYLNADYNVGNLKENLQTYWDLLKPDGMLAGGLQTTGWWTRLRLHSIRSTVRHFAQEHRVAMIITSDGRMWMLRKTTNVNLIINSLPRS